MANGNLSAESIPQGFAEKTNRNDFLRREILATTVCHTRQIETMRQRLKAEGHYATAWRPRRRHAAGRPSPCKDGHKRDHWMVLIHFELLGPKDRQLVSPVREGGVDATVLPERRSCATICASPSGLWVLSRGWVSPPSRTGLLTAGPSDLKCCD
jgi:hypothetical protein